jgi:hypothetical protein
MDKWAEIMHLIRRAHSSKYYDIFFIIVLYMGGFFLMNLMIAI